MFYVLSVNVNISHVNWSVYQTVVLSVSVTTCNCPPGPHLKNTMFFQPYVSPSLLYIWFKPFFPPPSALTNTGMHRLILTATPLCPEATPPPPPPLVAHSSLSGPSLTYTAAVACSSHHPWPSVWITKHCVETIFFSFKPISSYCYLKSSLFSVCAQSSLPCQFLADLPVEGVVWLWEWRLLWIASSSSSVVCLQCDLWFQVSFTVQVVSQQLWSPLMRVSRVTEVFIFLIPCLFKLIIFNY